VKAVDKPIIAVSRVRGVGGVNVDINGSGMDIMTALSAIAMSIMTDLCRGGKFEEKEVAEMVLYAVKLGIEKYLEEEHGGKGGADYGEV